MRWRGAAERKAGLNPPFSFFFCIFWFIVLSWTYLWSRDTYVLYSCAWLLGKKTLFPLFDCIRGHAPAIPKILKVLSLLTFSVYVESGFFWQHLWINCVFWVFIFHMSTFSSIKRCTSSVFYIGRPLRFSLSFSFSFTCLTTHADTKSLNPSVSLASFFSLPLFPLPPTLASFAWCLAV